MSESCKAIATPADPRPADRHCVGRAADRRAVARTRFAVAAALAALLAGCSFLEPLPDPSRYYVLTAVDDAESGGPPLTNVSLGLGPIRLPDYVRRQEVVRRTGPTEVQPSPVDRWAGGLDGSVSRVISEDLSRMLGIDRIAIYPSLEITRADFMVEITMVRFDLDTENNASLNARWLVRERAAEGRSVSRETQASQPATTKDTAGGVEALSRAVADLSRDIAAAVRELHAKK